jgi:acyl dehydratase
LSKKIVIESLEDFRSLNGKSLLVSEPIEITEQRIQDFCRGTLNDEWIHWDRDRCRASHLGDIIAPGLMLPALFPHMFWQVMDIRLPRMIVKKIEDIHILTPIRVGSQIVGFARVADVLERNEGIEVRYAIEYRFEGDSKVVATACFVNRYWED